MRYISAIFFLLMYSAVCKAEPSVQDIQKYATRAKSIILPTELKGASLYVIDAIRVQSGPCMGRYALYYRFVEMPLDGRDIVSGYVQFSPEAPSCNYTEKVVLDADAGGLGFRFFDASQIMLSFAQAKDAVAKKIDGFVATGDFQIAQPMNPSIEHPLYFIPSADRNVQVPLVDSVTGEVF